MRFRTPLFWFLLCTCVLASIPLLAQDCSDFSLRVQTSPNGCQGLPQDLRVAADGATFPVDLAIIFAAEEDTVRVQLTQPGFNQVVEGRTGSVEILATDAAGCEASAVAELVVAEAPFVFIDPPNPSICPGETVVLTANYPDNIIDPILIWSDGSSADFIEVSQPGSYTVSVIDGQSGCEATASAVVLQGGNFLSLTDTLVSLDCGGDVAVLSPNVDLPDFTFEWRLNNEVVGTESTLTVSRTGFYILRVTSPEGCQDRMFFEVSSNDIPRGEDFIVPYRFTPIDTTCAGTVCLGIDPNFSLGNITGHWTGPDGEGVDPDPILGGFQICVDEPGLYQLELTTDCDTVLQPFFVESVPDCTVLRGRVSIDTDADCTRDFGEPPLQNVVVQITDGFNIFRTTTVSGTDGSWSIGLEPGAYEVVALAPEGGLFTECGPAFVMLGDNNEEASVDLLLSPAALCPLMETSVQMTFLRRCFQNSFAVSYANNGSATAENARLEVELDDFFVEVTANRDFTLENGVYVFDLGNLPPGATGRVRFTARVSCEAELGQAHCVAAAVFPDEICSPPADFSGPWWPWKPWAATATVFCFKSPTSGTPP